MNESDPRSDVHYLGSSENKRCTGIAEVMGRYQRYHLDDIWSTFLI